MKSAAHDLPVIDVGPLANGIGDVDRVIDSLASACVDRGFFYIVGHGVDPALIVELDEAARRTFALPEADKARIAMAHGGPAWRGWFPLDGELTSGRPDHKEGLYFGQELDATDSRVRSGLPLHGSNQFPDEVPELRDVVLRYLDALTELGHHLVRGLALSLGVDPVRLGDVTSDPVILFRIFRYPPQLATPDPGWGVAEHTDYGLLTMLLQDGHGGLEVKTGDEWVAAPPIEGSFVCNIGDMLERMTGGRYRSTPHRVRNATGVDRLSFPFFFDPSWDARVPQLVARDGTAIAPTERWDGADVFAFDGTYGDYLLSKVARVFPALRDTALEPGR